MNNTIKVLIAILLFVSCGLLVYFIPFENIHIRSDRFNHTDSSKGAEVSYDSSTSNSGDINFDSNAIQVEEPVVEIVNEASLEIVSVQRQGRSARDYKKIGYGLTVKAEDSKGGELCYYLFKLNDDEPSYISNTGYFPDVYPVDGGQYLLRAVNTGTGASAEQIVGGFDKVHKLTAAELQAKLNADDQETFFYFYFDNDHLTINVSNAGVISSTSLNALLSDKAALGWTITVIGSPSYDEYNRIVSFNVSVQ